MKPLTYKSSGVDIEAGNEFVRRIARITKKTHRPEVVSSVGGFAGICSIPKRFNDPLLVSSTDGVGTKLRVAFVTNVHSTIGIDLVAMGVNDILTVGAEPLFFLDYFSTGILNVDVAEDVITGIIQGCCEAGCTLLGGETAEMPNMYPPGEYDLAGFAVGVVERDRLIDGSNAQVGDIILGLPSSGLHSNGYSLARKVLMEDMYLNQIVPELNVSLKEELLRPTKIYSDPILQLLKTDIDVRAIAHITGGGLIDNPPRCIPERLGLAFSFDTKCWKVPPVMDLIARKGNIAKEEMYRTFNMGLGMLVIIPSNQRDLAVEALSEHDPRVVGKLIMRTKELVEFSVC